MSLFHFFFRRQPLEQRLPLKTFILEPILTPSGLIDGGEETPHPLIWELDSDNLPDLHNGFSSLDVSGVDDAANCNVAADNWLPTGEDIEPLEFIHQLDATELNFQNPSVEIGVQELLALPMAISNPTFNSGVFTVGTSGEVSIDFLFDGGGYQGELAIFSLDGMDQFQPGSEAFIQAAAHRVLTDSILGHTVISDAHEGSRFSGIMPGEWSNQNWGEYLGVKTFNMRPGDTFGIMLVPNGTVQEVFDNPAIGGDKYPLFSLSTNNEFPLDQIADVTGDGSTFVMEDLRVDWWTDRDYNDFIFQIKGATGSAQLLDNVINPDLEWRDTTLGQEILNYAHHGQTDVDVVLQEGNDFNAAWSQTFSVPADPSVLTVTFSDLNFDPTDPDSINDALEISLVDASDRPWRWASPNRSLVHTIGEGRHAFFNLTEGQPTALAPGVTFNGNSVSVDLSQLEPGTEAKLFIHLVNNDLDSGTSVRIDQVQIHPSEPGIIPVTTDLPAERIPDGAINFTSLADVSSSLTAEYGQTSFNPDTKVLYADLAVRNAGDYLVRGSLLVGIDHISDPTVLVRDADGITPDGIPYYNLTQLVQSGILSPGELTANQTLEFYNPQGHQFTYDLVFLSQLNSLPQFATTPKVEAIVGKPYIYEAKATDPDGDALTYSLLAGAAGMSIEPHTGRITWNPSAGDIGTQTVTLQVEDSRGGTAQQQYILSAIIPPPNRPPIFTSIPVVDGKVNTAYTYQAIATDADSDSLSFSLVNSPAGMQVDPHTGIVSWLPEGNQLGIHDVILRVTDDNGGIADQRFQVQTQIAPGNHAPIITSEPQSNFLLNAATLFEDNFNSENGGSYNLNFTNYANWVVKRGDVDLIGQGSPYNFYPGNGLYVDLDGSAFLAALFESKNTFILTPGEYELKFDLGNPYSQTNTVTVALGDIFRETFTFPNKTTSFTHITRHISVPQETTAKLSFDHTGGDNAGLQLDNVQLKRLAQQYSYSIEATDPDSDPLTYSLVSSPQGMTINALTGEIAWVTPVVGQHSVAVKVQDNRGGVDTQQFNLNVTPGEAKSEIWGTVWSDGNADGVKDAVETGLSGVKVYLDQNSNGAFDAGEPTTETDGQGQYKFTGLTPGNYVVREVLPNDFAYTSLLGANLLKNASFEQGQRNFAYNLNVPAGSTLIPDWQVIKGSVDYVTYDDWKASDGEISIDLNGLETGGISQTFSTVPGQKYLVSFDLGANSVNPPGTQRPVQVKAAGQSAVFFGISTGNPNNMEYQPHSWEFTANSTSTTLEFLSTTSGYYGPAIDNISAVEIFSPNNFRQVVTLASGQIAEDINFGNNRVNQVDQNHQPNFTSSNPPTTVTVGELWRYKASASDPDQDALTYELLVKPEGMTVDPETGLVVWKPTSEQSTELQWARSTPGIYDVVLAVKDEGGGIDLQSFQVQVKPTNNQPVITSISAPQAVANLPYQYQVLVQDADSDPINYRLDAAPSGMSIDPATGILNWTPTSAQLGNQSVTLTASDGRGGQTSQSFQLSVVASAPNTAPTITSTPRLTIGLGQPYLYQVTASDPNGDPLAYTLLTAPAGMTLDATGQIFWQPTATQFGSNPVSLKVADGRGGEAVQSFTINVVSQPSNQPPTITSTPELTATVQQQYQYNLQGSDPDGDTLLWSLDSAPAGMSIDPQRGTLRWTPQLNQIGDQEVAVRATDAAGNYIGQAFTLSVRGANLPPSITSSPLTAAAAGKTYQYALQAQDSNNDPLTYTLLTAPAGMTINSQTGLIQWTPTIAQLGQQQVAIQVADAHGGQVTQPYTIVVAENSTNLAPAITSNPIFTASTGELYAYDVAATDPENQPLVYQLRSAPEGMTIDPTTGLIQWTPAAHQLGIHSVDVGAADSEGLGGGQRFTVTVTANVAPTITSVPKEQATVGQPYRYDIKATDANGDKLSYTLIQAPPGMTVDASGRISWQPTDIGNQSIVVSVKDTLGATVEQSYTLSVTADTVAPKVSLVATQSQVNLGSTVTFAVSAVDNVKVESLQLLVNGIPVALDAQGKATVKLSQVGDISAVATATDGAGNVGTFTTTIRVIDPSDISAPTVNLNLPNSTITAPIQITGTVTDSNLDYYKLEVAPVAGGEFVEIFRGNNQVVNGVLGQFDPSLLSNDSYILRLTAVDGNGRSSITEETVDVAGNLKLGNFTLSFTDVEIPVSGIPINVTRTYDSLNAQTTDDFGYGWRLEFRDTDLRTSLKKPDEQQQELGVQNPFQDGTKVYITLPGGQRETFTFAPKPNRLSQFLRDPVTGEPLMFDPAFTSQKGSTNTLTVKGAQITKADGKYYGMNGVPYNPEDALFGQVYVLTTKEGIVYEIDAKTGDLLTVTDTNSNKLTYSDAGIISSTGQSVKFERDAKNRIVAVVDPMGNKVKYEYDSQGDLVAVTDRENNQTQLVYDEPERKHFLTEVIDPLGRTGAKTEYDDQGRLQKIINGANVPINIEYNPEESVQIVKDAYGNPTVYKYDQRGNVLQVADAYGNSSYFEYDDNNNVTQSRDANNLVTKYQYDSQGNLISRTETYCGCPGVVPGTSRYTYNRYGQMTSLVTPTGASVLFNYDTRGNLLSIKDGQGNVIQSFTYYSNGLVRTETNGASTTYYEYDDYGNPIKSLESDGSATYMTYDANGRLQKMVQDHGTPTDTTDDETYTFTYDKLGREQRVDYGDGIWVEYGYTGSGSDWTSLDAPTIGHMERKLTDDGKLAGWVTPDGGTPTFYYDLAGRLWKETDAAGNITTEYEYDAAGRLTSIKDLRTGAKTTKKYDAGGRVIAEIDPLGAFVKTAYDPRSGKLTSTQRGKYLTDTANNLILDQQGNPIPDPAVNPQTWTYEYSGTRTTITDPLGRKTTSVQDANYLPVETIYQQRDGRDYSEKVKYLYANNLQEAKDYPTEIIDIGGNDRDFTYDQFGRLKTATDLGSNVYSYTYGEDGLALIESPNSITSSGTIKEKLRYEYDDLGNLVKVIYGDGTFKQMVYRSADNRLGSVILPSGETINYEYDNAGRVQSEITKSAAGLVTSTVTYTYEDGGNLKTVTNGNDTTTYHYDSLTGALSGIDYPDGSGIAYSYDLLGRVKGQTEWASASGVRYVTSYSYDAFGNLATVTDPAGGLTQMFYDDGNRLVKRILPDGKVTSTYEYDDLDRVKSIVHKNDSGEVLASISYERQGIGEPTKITREDGSYVTLVYDESLRVKKESYYNAVGALQDETTYTYDAAGKRIGQSSTNGGDRAFSYTPGYQLDTVAEAGETENYDYDSNGRLTLIERDGKTLDLEHDSYDRLTEIENETNGETIQYVYDSQGNRIKAVDGSQERRFLVTPAGGSGLQSTDLMADANGNLITNYIYAGGSSPFMRLDASGNPIYYLTDGMGSVIGLADGTGQEVGDFRYDSFGNLRGASGAANPGVTGGDFRFQGQWLESESGLYYFRARDYDSQTGLFLSRDPVDVIETEPESFNPYQFVYNNPYVYSDPTGMFTILELNAFQSIETTLAGIKTYAGQEAKNYLLNKVGDIFGNVVLSALNAFLPGSSLHKDVMSGVTEFENGLQGVVCPYFDGLPLKDNLFLEVRIDNGVPQNNGFNCSNYNQPSTNPKIANKLKSLPGSHPDFLFRNSLPVSYKAKDPGAYIIGDVKFFIGAARNDILSNDNQWQNMAKYASSYQILPFVSYLALFKTNVLNPSAQGSGGISKADELQLAEEALKKNVILILANIIDK